MDTKVLKKYEISSSLMRLIDDANDYVVLITPYLKLWGHLTQVITTAIERGIPVSIIVRDDYSDEKKSVGYDLDNTLEEL